MAQNGNGRDRGNGNGNGHAISNGHNGKQNGNGNGHRLTPKQRAFVDAYLGAARMNATEAAAMAGYAGNRATLGSVGSENLSKPAIRAEIERYLAANGATAQEVLSTLADQMRASVEDFVDIPAGGRIALLDLDKAQARGKMHLVKRLYWTQYGPRLELHDSQKAAELLGRALRLWVDRVEEEHSGEVVLRFAKPDEWVE